ncbi:MAG: hypothetical protein A2445_04395 [Candidatus Jacksonbacteria bacterium RIFOXYC2_FULL_44_29]|nr:MAG: hypothetical protein UW45_C0011G0007 [Parcubacteria group bacterium GW2011_GWC2_44_22]OGY76855.1 MAG: hypothetical protein A2240_04770 [Candidatus Jacksonbacteria bacterium RIFOXYA2_FULL_43_12]OGY77626.1 MAG: hypothetical protein A2445_04395 [Candidatus Jacksonbacteria bacterium RIFOXYC2_FULL_44_29]OGY80292.1 MAG: hypothetical protein A2550_04050 [Candidatus Jacksonbacteria bacterium RIFOXYD2_FULL_43_21]HBH45799.1 hypothetical protein [Candidatus Jacksonbacteria bacterium]
MSGLLNKIFLLSCAFVLLLGVIAIQGLGWSNHSADGSRKNIGQQVADARIGEVKGVNVKAAAPEQDFLNLFFNQHFLNIQDSIIASRKSVSTPQAEVLYKAALAPPQQVQVRDLKTGRVVVITWERFATDASITIRVLRSETAGIEGKKIAEVAGTSLGYYDFDVKTGGTYYYTLLCLGGDDQSETVGPYQIGPLLDLASPHPPTFVQTQVKPEGIDIVWNDPSDPDLKFINIYRSTLPGKLGQNIAQVFPGKQQFFDTKVSAQVSYYYLLTSQDEAGNESPFQLVSGAQPLGNPNPFTPSF